jgi:hypothetical protein
VDTPAFRPGRNRSIVVGGYDRHLHSNVCSIPSGRGVVYLCVGSLAHHVVGARPTLSRIVSRVPGASMIVIGAILLVERVTA